MGEEIVGFGKDFLKFLSSNQILNILWLKLSIADFIRTLREHMVETRRCKGQKLSQLHDISGIGCAWYDGQNIIIEDRVADCSQD